MAYLVDTPPQTKQAAGFRRGGFGKDHFMRRSTVPLFDSRRSGHTHTQIRDNAHSLPAGGKQADLAGTSRQVRAKEVTIHGRSAPVDWMGLTTLLCRPVRCP